MVNLFIKLASRIKYKRVFAYLFLLSVAFLVVINFIDDGSHINIRKVSSFSSLNSTSNLNNKIPFKIKSNDLVTRNYAKTYSAGLIKCHSNHTPQLPIDKFSEIQATSSYYNYSRPASPKQQTAEIIRAVIFYFPIIRIEYFLPEFKWLYKSWQEMLRSQPKKWRTDLVVFVKDIRGHKNQTKIAGFIDLLDRLNCSFSNRRQLNNDIDMCVLIEYDQLNKRGLRTGMSSNKMHPKMFGTKEDLYSYLFNDNTIFDLNSKHEEFYTTLANDLSHYEYVDSILIAFEGYSYLNGRYDYVIRSDMDVFLTPLFSKWTPRFCNDFYVGRGGYSDKFNIKRLQRIANNIGLKFVPTYNLGSTWYSTPDNFRLTSYLTLVSMIYISNEEFTPSDHQLKIGILQWPYWHYGVSFFNI
jgi:hypothetical protein